MAPVTMRRVRSLVLALLATAALASLVEYYDIRTLRGAYLSGWLLFTAFAVLIAFALRKRITVIALGNAYAWSQFHIYLGVVALFLYFIHVGHVAVNGLFESILAIVAIVTMALGFIGVALSRLIPPLMNRRGERIFLARIRGNQSMLRRAVDAEAEAAIRAGAGQYFFDFYNDQLAPYFARIRHVPYHLIASMKPYEIWDARFAVATSYLSADYRDRLQELRELLDQKIDLDFQYVSQWVLKTWLVLHIVFSFFLLVLVPLHLLLVYSFREG